jgi:hypothetical protein
MISRRFVLATAGSVLVIVAGLIVMWSSITTSTARLSASTGGSGFFSAGTVELDRPERTVALLFDADGLYPGQVVSSCVTIEYEGSLEADIRLHAARSGGTALEEHVVLRLWVDRGGSCPEPLDGTVRPADRPAFDGLLGDLWRAHPDFAVGLPLLADAGAGDSFALWGEAVLTGGDEAQGLTTDFTVTIEARP